jgi:hypothetical protein
MAEGETPPVSSKFDGARRCVNPPGFVMAKATADANDNRAMSGGRRRPTTALTVANAANVDDDEVASGGRRCLTTATTIADAAMTPRPRGTGAAVPPWL